MFPTMAMSLDNNQNLRFNFLPHSFRQSPVSCNVRYCHCQTCKNMSQGVVESAYQHLKIISFLAANMFFFKYIQKIKLSLNCLHPPPSPPPLFGACKKLEVKIRKITMKSISYRNYTHLLATPPSPRLFHPTDLNDFRTCLFFFCLSIIFG